VIIGLSANKDPLQKPRICRLNFFSTEIVLDRGGQWVAVDYVNDSCDLRLMEICIRDNPARSPVCSDVDVVCGGTKHLHGAGHDVLADLFALVTTCDPDAILMTDADAWMPKLQKLYSDVILGNNPKYSSTDQNPRQNAFSDRLLNIYDVRFDFKP
jgi:hypothetical protein